MNRRLGSKLVRWIAPIFVLGLFLLVWDRTVWWFDIHKVILPRPMEVMRAIIDERWVLLKGSWITFQSAALGLVTSAVVGSLVAMVFSQSSAIRLSFYPYVIFLQTVPIVAIAPLLILWFGNEFRTIVLVSCIISIFPIISNVTSGLLSVNENLRDLFRMQLANRWKVLYKLRIPAAIYQLILGLRISCGLAVIGAIVGEFFVGDRGAYEGLGTIITARQGNLNTASMIGAVCACAVLGLVLLVGVNLLSRTLLRRWTYGIGFESDK